MNDDRPSPIPAPLYQPTEADTAAMARHIAFTRSSPEAEQLNRLFQAVEHYRRMGWLELPEHEVWKYEDVTEGVRRLVYPESS